MNKTMLLLGLCAATVFSIGILMVFNTTSAEVLNKSLETSTHSALIKQAIYALIGIFLGIGVFFLGPQKIIRISPYLFWGCIVLLTLVFIPYIGQSINGAKRWVTLFGYTLQPSEFAKYLIPIYFINKFEKAISKLWGKFEIEKEKLDFFKVVGAKKCPTCEHIHSPGRYPNPICHLAGGDRGGPRIVHSCDAIRAACSLRRHKKEIQMKMIWAPSESSMKSAAEMMPSTLS